MTPDATQPLRVVPADVPALVSYAIEQCPGARVAGDLAELGPLGHCSWCVDLGVLNPASLRVSYRFTPGGPLRHSDTCDHTHAARELGMLRILTGYYQVNDVTLHFDPAVYR